MTAYLCGIAIKPLADNWPSVYPRLPIGTVVCLRSGSPALVIVDYDTAHGNYVCAWKLDPREFSSIVRCMDVKEELFSENVLTVVKMWRG